MPPFSGTYQEALQTAQVVVGSRWCRARKREKNLEHEIIQGNCSPNFSMLCVQCQPNDPQTSCQLGTLYSAKTSSKGGGGAGEMTLGTSTSV